MGPKILILGLILAFGLGLQALAQEPGVVPVPADDGVIDTNHKPKTLDIGNTLSSLVDFNTGNSQFLAGDAITITEIKGTSSKFSVGNSYQAKGTYTLASHPHAMLAIYTTAKTSAENDKGPYGNNNLGVEKGSGQFTLNFSIRKNGQTHISFYPSEGGVTFGGIYLKNK